MAQARQAFGAITARYRPDDLPVVVILHLVIDAAGVIRGMGRGEHAAEQALAVVATLAPAPHPCAVTSDA